MPSSNGQSFTFLSLAPATSESYPQQPPKSTPLTAAALDEGTKQAESNVKRRASSLSSDGAKSRVLKLGPVHWGEHPGDHKGDWHENAVVE
jgi:hypothetical protein